MPIKVPLLRRIRSFGIDPSTTATGLIVLDGDRRHEPELRHEEVFKPKTEKFAAVAEIVARIMALIARFDPQVIVIEGYGLNLRNPSSIIPLVTLGGVIRYEFVMNSIRYLEPTPGEHKRFVTGKGNSPKDLVAAHIAKRWGYLAPDTNAGDAYGHALIGLAQQNALPNLNNVQTDVLASLKLT